MRVSKVVAGAIFGVALIIFGAVFLFLTGSSFKNCTEQTTAVVIENVAVEGTDADGKATTFYHPVMEYVIGNKKIQSQYGIGTGSPSFEVGEQVAIKYDPDDTSNFKVMGDNTFTIVSIAIIVVGAGILVWQILPLGIYMLKRR